MSDASPTPTGADIDRDTIARTLRAARDAGREFLSDREGRAILRAMGIPSPAHAFVRDADVISEDGLDRFSGESIVVKVSSPEIQHRTDVGGVAIVQNDIDSVRDAIRRMEARLRSRRIDGFDLHEFVSHRKALGHELLLGMRWTRDMGPIVVLGPGGIYAEFLAGHFATGHDSAILSAVVPLPGPMMARTLRRAAVVPLITGELRGQPALIPEASVVRVVRSFLDVAREFMPDGIADFEINPLVLTGERLMALDVLVKLGTPDPDTTPGRPVHKIRNLLLPGSLTIIGVSEKSANPGRVILQNVLACGFDPTRITIVKPGVESIEGCRCVPDIASLPGTVDLAVLSVSAAQVPGAVTEFIEHRKTESLIVIPGGLEEKAGAEDLVGRMRAVLQRSRHEDWQGPLINGGNCLGIRSHPGRYDTLFIPRYKLPAPAAGAAPLALVCQSGAHLVANLDRLSGLTPRYAISVGNQTDVTIGDYLTYLADDREIDLFAVYAEGFRPLDGLRFMQAARKIADRGGTVLLYRAGRTPAGAQASQSHTASIAGEYRVTRALAEQAGVVLASSLNDFADLVQVFAFLREKPVAGNRLGAISNAGFECVAIADHLESFELARFTDATRSRLAAILARRGIDAIVDINNPIDLTPMMGDADYGDVIEAVMEDPNVDVGVVGCVPLTPALQTLLPGPDHAEDLDRDGAIMHRMVELHERLAKPWVAVIEGGKRFDPLARRLQDRHVPTFRSVDRAMRLFEVFCRTRRG